MMAFILPILLISQFASASGDTVMMKFELRNAGEGKKKFCYTDYAGWGESDWKCSKAVSESDDSLKELKKLLAKNSQPVISRWGGDGTGVPDVFTPDNIVNAIKVNNCSLSGEATRDISRINVQISELQKKIKSISSDPKKYSCDSAAKVDNKVPEAGATTN